jgi:uncharacterized membrane protein YGL010W
MDSVYRFGHDTTMSSDGKLMDMLTGYAAAHQHPFNILVHLIGIPTIMLGVLIPLTWVSIGQGATEANLGHILVFGFFVFYMSLDRIFAIVFLILALLLIEVAMHIGALPMATSGAIAAAAFFGGYALQFVGHAVEKSMPVLVKHPIQANLAAPFFTVVEIFKLLRLRSDLFDAVQREIASRGDVSAAGGAE